MNVEKIFNIQDKEKLITKLSSYMAKKCEYGDELKSLNEEEKNFYFVSTLEEEVNSGGFGSFFYNSYGDYTNETLEALKIMGAQAMEELFRNAMNQFENGIVPTDFEERQEIADELEDEEAWETLDEEFYEEEKYAKELLEKQYNYIMENKHKFI